MIYTIGHSTRQENEFLELLQHYQIEVLADIRTMPRSRWNPQFNRSAVERSVTAAGMEYMHIPGLGGLRKPAPRSVNLALKDPGLRGYADHMETAEFQGALRTLIQLARKKRVALMCAEASFEKCHRRLTSDALMARKIKVVHILSKEESIPHSLTADARVVDAKVTYPKKQSQLEF